MAKWAPRRDRDDTAGAVAQHVVLWAGRAWGDMSGDGGGGAAQLTGILPEAD
jgi:hypothetical protein